MRAAPFAGGLSRNRMGSRQPQLACCLLASRFGKYVSCCARTRGPKESLGPSSVCHSGSCSWSCLIFACSFMQLAFFTRSPFPGRNKRCIGLAKTRIRSDSRCVAVATSLQGNGCLLAPESPRPDSSIRMARCSLSFTSPSGRSPGSINEGKARKEGKRKGGRTRLEGWRQDVMSGEFECISRCGFALHRTHVPTD